MKALTQKFFASIENRFRRSRTGSVLIIVIVLLLLLAILGAAYISTTRSSRVASAQNVLSSDADTALNGIAQICNGVITDDLNDTFGDLHGNTAYVINPAPTSPIINHSYYQGQGAGTSGVPKLAPNVTTFNAGDIANTADFNASVFYYLPQGGVSASPIVAGAAGGTGWQVLNGHLPVTAVGSDPWLADRIPDPAGTGNPVWNHLTQSIQSVLVTAPSTYALEPSSILGTPFENPLTGVAIPPNALSTGALIGSMTPSSLALGNGSNAPALTATTGAPPATFIAMDADGDGIADSLPFRVPGLGLDGLTWYAGVRIIDNNSAINANTAWSRDTESYYAPNAGANNSNTWAMFQTSVGLQELMNTGDWGGATPSLATLNKYRFNDAGPIAAQNPYDETGIGSNRAPQANDRGLPSGAGTAHLKDYNFISQSEAFYQQFIRRMANPGYNTYNSGSPPTGARYQALPLSDEAALAYHFCLPNANSSSPQSLIETLLPDSLFWKTPPTIAPASPGVAYNSTPYDPANVAGWFSDNFAYPPPSGTDNLSLPLRALLVTHNPVSNYIPQLYNNNPGNPDGTGVYSSSDPLMVDDMLTYGPNTATGATSGHYRGVWNGATGYAIDDVVLYPGPTPGYSGPSYTFVARVANPAGAPANFDGNNVLMLPTTPPAAWALQPFSSNAVKANVNTATFRELFRAFWSVMAGNPSYATPFGVTGVDNFNTYDPTAPTALSPTTGNPQAMFRSPLRDPVGTNTANVSLLDAPAGTAPNFTVTNKNVMLLRAGLAAVNTLGLRDNSQNVISRRLLLKNAQIDNGAGGSTNTRVEAMVYSNAPQPFISEVFVCTSIDTDTQAGLANPQGYVAVELYNPYPFTLTLTNWQLGLINRNAAGSGYPNLLFQTTGITPNLVSVIGPMQPLNDPTVPGNGAGTPPAGAPIKIPAHGYALLENYNVLATAPAQAGDALFRPSSAVNGPPTPVPPVPGSFWETASGTGKQTGVWYGPNGAGPVATPANTCDVYVPNLQLVIGGTSSAAGASLGGELVLLRPRRADGTYTLSTDADNTFNEGTPAIPNLADLIPVDSYDFSGLPLGTAGAGGQAWSYVRMKGANPLTWFKQVFPGFYQATPIPREGGSPGQGTAVQLINAGTQTWQGTPTPPTSAVPAFGVDALMACYVNNYPAIQVYNSSANAAGDVMHFPNSLASPQHPYPTGIAPAAGQAYLHPLGGFARNGDMLDIPYIGAYRIRQVSTIGTNPQFFVEMNSLPRDCSLAAVETSVPQQDAGENIGRFVPMAASFSYLTLLQGGGPTGTNLPDYSAWTRNLFTYLTVQSGSDAYLPNTDPNLLSSNPTTPAFAYPPQNAVTPNSPIPPTPVLTADATGTDQTKQDNVGVEGLININTASWKVLSMLPFASPAADANAAAHDQAIAKAIVLYRDGDGTAANPPHGPFMSIFDLNQVPGFQNGTGALTIPSAMPTPPTSTTGLISPPDPLFPMTTAALASNVPEDYQWDCMTLDRISNLITTRSDTFTVYVVLQGWQNVGGATGPAQPMITRRFAYIVDRSAINSDPSTRFLKTVIVPND
ncbi:MAG TPA: hypothetical protein VGG44_09360 [Tepidisphaeraceae bacterium]